MFAVCGVPSELGDTTVYDGQYGEERTFPVQLRHPSVPVDEFHDGFIAPDSLRAKLEAAAKAGVPVICKVKEFIMPGGKRGHWVKRIIREVVAG